jgi:hypothetical protein
MLKKILLVLLAVVALFAIYVATRPSDYRVQRTVLVNAPTGKVFPLVVIFRRWEFWSPWAKLDPGMKVEFGGPKGGVGSTYSWKGNEKVGEGKMTMIGALPNQLVDIQLDFVKPWEQTANVRFDFKPEGDATRVTWTMSGKYDFVGKLFAVFMDMDKTVGPDLEKGLAQLKELGERRQAADE